MFAHTAACCGLHKLDQLRQVLQMKFCVTFITLGMSLNVKPQMDAKLTKLANINVCNQSLHR